MSEYKMPTQERAIETRNKIINASFELFAKKGYKKTNTIIIAKKAKVSVGIVYSYFKDKDELLNLWLNHLLEASDSYFYNQFKLINYDVELSLIISNILEKICDSFFNSPIVYETSPYVIEVLDNFYEKGAKIFLKACNDANIFMKSSNEMLHVLINIVKAYHYDLLNPPYKMNLELLKSKYIAVISYILKG